MAVIRALERSVLKLPERSVLKPIAEFGMMRERVKLRTGHMLLYSARALHQVMPVRRSAR